MMLDETGLAGAVSCVRLQDGTLDIGRLIALRGSGRPPGRVSREAG